MSLIVIDASITIAWYFQDESTEASEAVFDQVSETGAIVPALWRMEVANALQIAVRRKRIGSAYRDDSLHDLGQMPITTDPDTDAYVWSMTLPLADRFDLTVYDASYLELAQRRDLPLATLDKKLYRAATVAGVELVGG